MGNFLEYSNANHCNIIPKDEFETLTKEVFNVIANNLGKSLGPLGSSATILDGMMTEATKDGYSILNKYRFHNRYKRMIYNLIKAPCTRLNNTVGDGTTTAICLTDALFNNYQREKPHLTSLYRLPRQFIKAWDTVIADITEAIAKQAVPIDPEDYETIYNIAYVVSNGSDEISKNIADVYHSAKFPAIKQKDSPTNKSYITPIKGFDFPAKLLSEAYARNEDLSAQENDICVMIFDHKVDTDIMSKLIIPINDALRAQGKKLLILAPYYDNYMCETLVSQLAVKELHQQGAINLILAIFEFSKLKPNQMNDLAVVLRGKVINQALEAGIIRAIQQHGGDMVAEKIMESPEYEFYRTIGNASEAYLSFNTGSMFSVNDIESDEVYQSTLKKAEQELEDIKTETGYERQAYAAKIYDANARILQLRMRNYIYYIGADSQLQKQITWDSVDDVIKCIGSAIKFGVVPGCQLSIVKACKDLMSEIVEFPITDAKIFDNVSAEDRLRYEILCLIYSSILDVYCKVLHGAEGLGMIKIIPRWQYTTKEGVDALKKEAIEKADEIISTSVEKMEVFDMETLEYNKNIITSAETDMMVLSAASDLVKVLISGNQCIFLDSEINESHQETVDTYV